MENKEDHEGTLREHLLYLLRGGGAHVDFDSVVADLKLPLVNRRLPSVPYTIWHVLEHMRIAQRDILEFSRNPQYQSPSFPEGYWPTSDSVADENALHHSIEQFRTDLREMEALVAAPQTDLFMAIPHGEGQTILREALLVADHNAYHLGVIVVMKRMLAAERAGELLC